MYLFAHTCAHTHIQTEKKEGHIFGRDRGRGKTWKAMEGGEEKNDVMVF